MNLYTFVQNNPVGREDPSGRQSQPSKGVDSNNELVANIAKSILQESAPVELPPLTQKEQDSQAQLEAMAYDKTPAPKLNEVRVNHSVTDRAHMKQLDDLELDPPGHPAEAKSFKPVPGSDLRLRLEKDYADFVPATTNRVDLSTWPSHYIPRAGGNVTGVFVLVGYATHEGPAAAGLYISGSYSERHGLAVATISEAGTKKGPVEVTGGFEWGVGTKEHDGKHEFYTPTTFAQVGSEEFGTGIATETGKIGDLRTNKGEVSPFVYFPLPWHLTMAIGVDIDLERSLF